jgi:hypothetical protein
MAMEFSDAADWSCRFLPAFLLRLSFNRADVRERLDTELMILTCFHTDISRDFCRVAARQILPFLRQKRL